MKGQREREEMDGWRNGGQREGEETGKWLKVETEGKRNDEIK